MQINRLFEMIYLLLGKDTITAKDLAAHFEVSIRTIYRDVEVLSGAGIPIYMSKGKGGGIRLMEHFVLNKSVLSEQDQHEILSALQGLGAISDTETDQVLSKLSVLFHKSSQNWIEVDFSDWNGNNDKWRLIKSSILNYHYLAFEYFNSYGGKSVRYVKPIKLWFKDRSWYLKAYCCEKQDLRIFKLSRMKVLEMKEETFEPIADESSIESSDSLPEHTIKIVMNIDKSQSYRVYDEFDETEITKNKDGSFTIAVSFPDGEWIYGYILSYGAYAKVVEPKEVRNQIKERLKKSLEQYL
jgi:predicted DNA-binding transcriptional regulator YafY